MELIIRNKKGECFTILYDEEDHNTVVSHTWCVHKSSHASYAQTWIRTNGKLKLVGMHRVLLGVSDRAIVVDHKNRNGLDNRRCNIRACTQSENLMNRATSRKSPSKFLGVTWDKFNKKWLCSITIDGKLKNLGRFSDEIKAAKVYDSAAIIRNKDFANLNFKST